MREWLSGRASPCQGERREFESRLPLLGVRFSYSFFIFKKYRGCRLKQHTPFLCVLYQWQQPRGLVEFRCRKDESKVFYRKPLPDAVRVYCKGLLLSLAYVFCAKGNSPTLFLVGHIPIMIYLLNIVIIFKVF